MFKPIVLLFLAFIAYSYGAICQNPKVTATTASTRDSFFHSSAAFIVDLNVKCSNDAKNVALYGEVNGRIIPAAHVPDTDRYQISWTEEHSKTKSGRYQVNVVDEDGYSAIRKAIRNNEEYASKIKPLTSATIDYAGPTSGQYISSETVAVLIAVVVYYFAYSWKSALQS